MLLFQTRALVEEIAPLTVNSAGNMQLSRERLKLRLNRSSPLGRIFMELANVVLSDIERGSDISLTASRVPDIYVGGFWLRFTEV